MPRLTLERALPAQWIGEVFDDHRPHQYPSGAAVLDGPAKAAAHIPRAHLHTRLVCRTPRLHHFPDDVRWQHAARRLRAAAILCRQVALHALVRHAKLGGEDPHRPWRCKISTARWLPLQFELTRSIAEQLTHAR
jgi:hypothetical protein